MLEHGAYRRLMDVYYSREEPLPDAQVERLVCARSTEEREAVRTVLGEFFTLSDGAWSHSRCDAEIAKYLEKQNKARKSANARWSKPQCDQDADAMRTHTERNADGMLPLPTTHFPLPSKSKDDSLPGIVSTPSAAETNPPVSDADEPEEDLLGVVPAARRKRDTIPCPGQKIADLWDKILVPEAAQIAMWTERRARLIGARWKDQAEAEGWQTQEEGLAWMERLFTACRTSKFLMGKVPPKQGHLQFRLKFDWFFGAENFIRIIEGDFHRGK